MDTRRSIAQAKVYRLKTETLCSYSPYCGKSSCPKYYSRDDDIRAIDLSISVKLRNFMFEEYCEVEQ